jgi:branched-chain amino acid transport system permease protein
LIPRINFFGTPFIKDEHGFAAIFGLPFFPIERTIFLYYLILALALLTNVVTKRLRRLPLGRAWEALREDEIACRSLGINTVAAKLSAFAIGACIAGIAGAFFAVRQGFVSPSSFGFIESATILSIVVLGGAGSQAGIVLAAILIIGGSEFLRELDVLQEFFGYTFDPTQYRMLLVGIGMVIMMNWRPRGLLEARKPTIFLKDQKPIEDRRLLAESS